MFYWLLLWLSGHFASLTFLNQPVMRAVLAAITALVIVLWTCPILIDYLVKAKRSQPLRIDGPQSHLTDKAGTPTMGGLVIILALSISILLWADLNSRALWVVWLVTLGFSILGAVDDYRKLTQQNSKGLSARWKYCWQSLIGLMSAFYLWNQVGLDTLHLHVPFMADGSINLGLWFIPLAYFVVVGSSNAVNLTDGLDGLAIMPVVLVSVALGVFAFCIANRPHIMMVPYFSVTELMIFAAAIAGAGLGFLRFNAYPAQIFMGDVGSLGLGAALGILAVILRQEITLLIMGGVFVLETVSVILQVGSFKLRGKRIFKMAPLHHHFELKGWSETTVIVRFWILTFALVIVGLMSLKF